MAVQCGPLMCFPIDVTRAARPQPGTPAPGRDPRAPADRTKSTCKACRHFGARNDWEHTREIGQCWCPHDEPWIPECEACQKPPRPMARNSLLHAGTVPM